MENSEQSKSPAPLPRNLPKADLQILSQFDTFQKSAKICPKKEFLRCKLIRGHKRAIRQILSNQNPKATIHKFDQEDSKAQSIWCMIKQVCNSNEEEFQRLCRTESGPATDGRAKRSKESINNSEKSFNSKFCRSYFGCKAVRDSFSLYLDLIFSNFDPAVLSKKFEFFCCRKEAHSIECLDKWVSLNEYLKNDMLTEIGCEALEGSCMIITFPTVEKFLESDE